MKFGANKEFMGNLSLQFVQTTDGGTKITCGRQSGMDGCMQDKGSNLHADASFSGPFVLKGWILRFGACASHDIRLILKTKIDKLNCISEMYVQSLRILVSPESFLFRPFTILCSILISAISPLLQHLIIQKADISSHHDHFESE